MRDLYWWWSYIAWARWGLAAGLSFNQREGFVVVRFTLGPWHFGVRWDP